MKNYFQDFINYLKTNLFARLGIQIIIILVISILSLFVYIDYKMVSAEDTAKQVTADLTSQSVLDKIDRNFYERFGDVQAFAVNKLAVRHLTGDSSAYTDLQTFMNTMTQYYVLYDLMMVVDLKGKVQIVNNIDKRGIPIVSKFIVGQSVVDEDWFNACIGKEGPEGGAWYSDFCTNRNVSKIYHSHGWGMGFAAPIKDENGTTIGVWYNFANWGDVTQYIRTAQEKELHVSQPDANIFITGADGKIIDAVDSKLIQDEVKITPELTNSWGFEMNYNGRDISFGDRIQGWATAKGAYIYKGRNWNALTIIPESKITLATFFAPDMTFAMIVIICLVSIFSYYIFKIVNNQVINKTLYLKNVLDEFSNGNIPTIEPTMISKDEIGQIVKRTKDLSENLENMVQLFEENVSQNSGESSIVVFNNKGKLGTSLIKMRSNLKNMLEEDYKRNWANTGIAQISDILRQHTENPEALFDETIKFIVKYAEVNQGAIFLINDDNQDMLDLVACYAFNKKKFIEKNIEKGEGGLVWQTILEGESIYLTKIPEDYIEIKSGLGGANPSSILIVPLKSNEITFGVIEIAAFTNLDKYKIDFVEKIAESVASSVASVKTNAKTKTLLEISKQQAEEMRSAEEEMRQNLEEMSATQEEMHRKEMEMDRISSELNDYLIGLNSAMATIEFTPKGEIITANDNFLNTMGYTLDEIIGKHHKMFVPQAMTQSDEYQNFWLNLAKGKAASGTFERVSKHGKKIILKAAYTPIKNEHGVVTKVVKFAMEL